MKKTSSSAKLTTSKRKLILVCAWCKEEMTLNRAVGHSAFKKTKSSFSEETSHGICPKCLAGVKKDYTYPTSPLQSSSRREWKNRDGMTLIEMMVAFSIIGIVGASALTLYLTGVDSYETASAYVTAETFIQIKLDEVMDELAETAEANLTIYSWIDPLLGTDMQEALCFSSARNAAKVFVTNNGRPQWQSVVVIAPYSQSGRGQIRRYESFGTYTFPLSITNISNAQITLSNGIIFNRSSGLVLMGNVAALDAQAMQITMQNPISLAIKAKLYLPKGVTKDITLQGYIDCRNANEQGAGGLYDE
ncbi:MAG: prepilin-type N-terminal cleavage/methylation domain-containing protein [Planctomycetota bacterium]